jgi:hypothetical protein
MATARRPATPPQRAVRKRSQLKTKAIGEETYTERDKANGEFVAQKMTRKFKGVRREKPTHRCPPQGCGDQALAFMTVISPLASRTMRSVPRTSLRPFLRSASMRSHSETMCRLRF